MKVLDIQSNRKVHYWIGNLKETKEIIQLDQIENL